MLNHPFYHTLVTYPRNLYSQIDVACCDGAVVDLNVRTISKNSMFRTSTAAGLDTRLNTLKLHLVRRDIGSSIRRGRVVSRGYPVLYPLATAIHMQCAVIRFSRSEVTHFPSMDIVNSRFSLKSYHTPCRYTPKTRLPLPTRKYKSWYFKPNTVPEFCSPVAAGEERRMCRIGERWCRCSRAPTI